MTNQTEQGAAEAPSPELLRMHQAGTTLANIAFNLAQCPGEPLTSDVVASLDSCRREWDAACAAFKAARVALAKSTPEGYTSVPAGYALVPLEPTEAMVDAFENAMEAASTYVRNFPAAYRAMVAAATAKGQEP